MTSPTPRPSHVLQTIPKRNIAGETSLISFDAMAINFTVMTFLLRIFWCCFTKAFQTFLAGLGRRILLFITTRRRKMKSFIKINLANGVFCEWMNREDEEEYNFIDSRFSFTRYGFVLNISAGKLALSFYNESLPARLRLYANNYCEIIVVPGTPTHHHSPRSQNPAEKI